MSDYNLGTARGVIEIDYRGNGATQASRDLRATGSAATDANQKMDRAGRGMMVAGAVIAGGLALAVNSAADFEKQLSNVQAVSGASAAEMEQLRAKSLQLGKDTAFSASESAGAIEELVKAGLSVQDVMNGAADATVNLAAAGEVSMPEAATIASNAMNQFNLAAEDMVGVADNIAGAANASAIDVSDFGMSLSQVGAVANLAGAKFEDTATAIALMGNAGIKGSDAGTSLKSMLMTLQPTTEKQINLMEDLGIVTEDGANKFYDAEGNLKSLADVSGILQKSLEGQTKAQKQANLETIFGSDGIRAAAILADNGAKGFDKMATAMGKVSAADVAATKLDNLAGSMEQLKGSLETLMIMVGTPLLNGIRAIVDGFTSFLNVILELPGPVLEAITVFLGVLSASLLLVGAFLKVRAAIQLMQAGMLLFTGPILLVIAAIAALVAAFVYFYKTNARFRAFVQEMGAVLRDALGKAMEWLIPKLQQFGAFLQQVFEASLPYLRKFGDVLTEAFQKALPYLKQAQAFVVRFKQIFIPIFIAMIAPILAVPIAIFGLVKAFQHFYSTSSRFRAIVQGIIGFLKELAGIFMDEVVPAVKEAAGTVLGALGDAFNKVAPMIPPLVDGVKDFIQSIVDLAKAIMGTPAFKFFISVIQQVAKIVMGVLIPLLVRLGGIFLRVFVQVIGNALRMALGIIRGVLNVISGVIKVFTGILTGDWRKAWEGVKQILRGAVGILGSILRGFMSTAGAIIRGIASAIVAGVRAIPGMLRGLGGLFLSAGKFIIDQFVQGIKNAAGLIEGIASNVWNFVRGLLNGAIGSINAALEFTVDPPGPGSVTVNPPDIPALAKGGVLTAPTMAWVAEAGEDEAVIPLRQLWRQMDAVYKAGRTTLGDPESRSGSRGAGSGTGGSSGRSRLVQGRLTIDRSGRAFIQGIAEDVYDGNDRFNAAYERMGG